MEVLVWTSKQPWRMRQAAAGSDNAAADHTVATGWMGKGLWHIQHACTTTVAHYKTRWKTKARARCRVVIWLTSDLTLMCVGADQEHSPLMGEHRLGCSTLSMFYHGKRSHALVTQCVRVRACKNPRRGFEEARWRLFVLTDMEPCYRNSPYTQK